ncbi:MAG: SLC13 family permease [Candidatus Methanomethylophilaceae archaeon]
MSLELIIAAIIFVITYAAISIRRLPGIEIGMHTAALAGGAAMLLFGIVSFTDALDSLNTDVLLLLLGMMLLVGALDSCGFFGIVADLLIKHVGNGRMFLVRLMVLSAFLSALMLNDAVVLILTPAVIRCCRSLRTDPIPYLVGVFISANIGSCATVVGNPQNAYIATHAGIGFMEFSMELVPMTIACLAVAILVMLIIFRKGLLIEPAETVPAPVEDRRMLCITVAIAVCTVIAFSVSGAIGVSIAHIALIGGALALLTVSLKGPRRAAAVVRRVDWSVLLFFIGLFVVMAGAVSSGLIDVIASVFPGFSNGNPSAGELALFSAVLSNLISNVPSVILIGDMMTNAAPAMWLVLSASSTLAGNLTMIGAAANVIVSEEAEKEGIRIDFRRYLKVGIPVSAATFAVMYVLLILSL